MDTFILGITLFTMIVLTLVSIIVLARSKLVSSGDVNITINGEKTVTVPAGGKLLQTLASEKLFVPSACGGGGTCAQSRVKVHAGGGSILPTLQLKEREISPSLLSIFSEASSPAPHKNLKFQKHTFYI